MSGFFIFQRSEDEEAETVSCFLFVCSFLRYTVCAAGGILLLVGLAVLSWIDQDDARHSFGHSGGFSLSLYIHIYLSHLFSLSVYCCIPLFPL